MASVQTLELWNYEWGGSSETACAHAKEWWSKLPSKLNGHCQYYGVSGNTRAIRNFHHHAMKQLHKWLNRRSRKGRMSRAEFNEYREHYPLPSHRIAHDFHKTISAADSTTL